MTMDAATLTTLAFYGMLIAFGVIACTVIVGGIAFWKTEKGGAKTFSLLLVRANALQMLAVILIVISAIILRLANAISSEAVVSILSGVAGYVLGGIAPKKDPGPEIDGE